MLSLPLFDKYYKIISDPFLLISETTDNQLCCVFFLGILTTAIKFLPVFHLNNGTYIEDTFILTIRMPKRIKIFITRGKMISTTNFGRKKIKAKPSRFLEKFLL